jgi:hypothetical protein
MKSIFIIFISGLSREVGELSSVIIYIRSKSISKTYYKAIILLSLFKININLSYNNIN